MSLHSNCIPLTLNVGIFKLIPTSSKIFLISKPLSARIMSPYWSSLISTFFFKSAKNPLSSTIFLSDIEPKSKNLW